MLGKRIMYRLPHYTSIAPRYGDWRSHALASHMVLEYDTDPEGEDGRKPPAPEGDTDSKGTAPDKGDTASKGTAPEGETDSKCTAPGDDIDRKSTAPDGGDADCYMIHIPTALETQIRATVVNRRHLNNRFRIEDNHYIKLDGGSDISVFKHIQAFGVLRYDRQSIPLGLTVGDNRILEMHGLGHVGPLRKCIWASNQEMSILSQTHYQRWFPNTVFVQYCNNAYIIRVDSPAANLLMMLHKLSNSGRKVASFACYQGSYIRQGYQFMYDRPDWARPTPRPTPPGVDMVIDDELNDSVRTINMMDASSRVFDMSNVAAAIAEADELPVWSALTWRITFHVRAWR